MKIFKENAFSLVSKRTLIIIVFFILSLFLVSQFWVSWEYKQKSQAIIDEFRSLKTTKVEDEKIRQEIISLKMQNEQQTLFLKTLLVNLSTAVGVIVAVSGLWLGFMQYLGIRNRERLDKAGQDLDRLWTGLTDESMNVRAASIAGMQHFFDPDRKEYHDRVASAIALVGQLEDNDENVIRILTQVVEQAFRRIPDSTRKVSWQGLKLFRPNLKGLDLTDYDFRDSYLKEADFTASVLDNARFNAAYLAQSTLDEAQLKNANLEYADLAFSSLKGADLANADLSNIKLLNLDIDKANLEGAALTPHAIDWRLFKNWRTAHFDQELKNSLLHQYGPPVSGPRVLMLLWEFIPIVSGGAWTAAFHLLKQLRLQGANITVMVPWAGSSVSFYEFGNEITLIPLGNDDYGPAHAGGPSPTSDTSEDESPSERYSSSYSSYYEANPSAYSSYYEMTYYSPMKEQVNDFTSRALDYCVQHGLTCDIVHAHDWPTFDSAMLVADHINIPWIAHFHSTEEDRRKIPDGRIKLIEQKACTHADRILMPSQLTRKRIESLYEVEPEKLMAIPNSLSRYSNGVDLKIGAFYTKNVIFVGRLTYQKAPERFIQMAYGIAEKIKNSKFSLYGDGEEKNELQGKLRTTKYIEYKPEPIKVTGLHEKYNMLQEMTINGIIAAEIDENKKDIKLTGDPVTSSAGIKEFEKLLLETGFTISAISTKHKYTHLIELDTTEKTQRHYLALIDGIEKVQSRTKVVELQNVQFCGNIDWEDRGKIYEEASVLVLPSRFEPFGMVILEAMMAGVPVVTEKDAGACEVLTSPITYDASDDTAGVNLVCSLLSDETQWKNQVKRQTEEIRAYIDETHEAEMIKLWEELISQGHNSSPTHDTGNRNGIKTP